MNPFWTVSLFWIAAVVCVAIALAFVLPALLRSKAAAGKASRREVNIAVYRDQMKELEADRTNGLVSEEQFQIAKLELEARLADLQKRLPAHSIPPALIAEWDELDEALSEARQRLEELNKDN